MLVETVEELEQEATCRVALLQNKLDECSEKVAENLNNMNELVSLLVVLLEPFLLLYNLLLNKNMYSVDQSL